MWRETTMQTLCFAITNLQYRYFPRTLFSPICPNGFCGNVIWIQHPLDFEVSLRKRSVAAAFRIMTWLWRIHGPPGYCSTIPCTLIRLISGLSLKACAATGTFKKQACTANSSRSGPSNECPRADIGCAKTRVTVERDEGMGNTRGKVGSKKETGGREEKDRQNSVYAC